ncbi:interleukin-1 alpha [Arvicanthis niloticus]|uniref:interleukin-1 alpha n=1 Tax=Arvicanthis niloticus TaxID=61156 RepID=UPI001485E222|nr:interleukin-1 alpha [Arvicanthis niloticus]XP_034352230.1 interleukin-1 alpha [Arvicanthis niloticus]
MAKVPDLFEDLKNCYSENEEYNSAIDHLSLNQKSFYDASYGSLHENCTDKFVSLRTSETSKMSSFTFKESRVMVSATSNKGKILKKRRLSFNQACAEDDLEVITHNFEETIQPRSAPYTFQSNLRYKLIRIVKQGFVMNDTLNQNIYLDVDKIHLKAASLTDLQHEVKFDMFAYSSGGDDSKYPVTLKISDTQLFVSAQGEDQPVLLKEIPETPKLITGSETDLIFFWKTVNSKNYFTSAAYPELFIATKEQSQVHLARGLPSMTDFQIS